MTMSLPLASLPILASSDPILHVVDHDFGLPFGLTKHVIFLLISAGICVTLLPYVVRRIAADGTGGRLGGFFESILLFIRDDAVRPFLGKEGDKFLPIIWSFFFFILTCNLIGLIPGGATCTGNINVTAALALVAFLFYHAIGLKKHGFLHYLKHNFLVGPAWLWPMMILIELMGHVIRPAALAVRLFANMVAGHLMLAVILSFTLAWTLDNFVLGGAIALVSAVSAVLLNFLEILVAVIQAFVFTFLTTVFLSLATSEEH